MKNKKGFTLIEIIICVGMLAVIAVGSIIGIHLVNKNLIIKELNQITNKAIQAAQVYIETNKEAQNQLYTEQNAVKIPIKVLVNEGLLSLKGTKLDNSKIKNEYVITALSTESGNSTECTNIDSKASWDNDKVIYICTNLNSKGEVTGSNLATIDPTKYNNRTKVSSEPYYFKGPYPNNYIDINNSNFDGKDLLLQKQFNGSSDENGYSLVSNIRILYIDRDDRIIIIGTFQTATPMTCLNILNGSVRGDVFRSFNNKFKTISRCIKSKDIFNTSIYSETENNMVSWVSNLENEIIMSLSTSVKIKSGTGTEENPFILEEK